MRCLCFLSLVFLFTTISQSSFSADQLQIGEPSYSGTGCEAGSATLTLSPDNTQLSVLFNNFVAQSGGSVGRQLDRKACILSLPIHIPSGFTLAIATVDYRGFMNLPKKTKGQFVASSMFAGAEKFRENRQFIGPYTDNFTFRTVATSKEMVWSQCGKKTILRTHAAIFVNSGNSGEETMGVVDSIDVAAGISYRFELKPCQNNQPPTKPLADPYPKLGGMASNTELLPGQGIRSLSGQFLFTHQTDGNVVMYGPQGPIWSTNTYGKSTSRLVMQTDGNLVLYGHDGAPLWHSDTAIRTGARLAIQDDGNVVLYDAGNAPRWWISDPYPKTGEMGPNVELLRGQGIRSPSGQFLLIHQDDGNVVMYGPQGPIWATGTQSLDSARFVMQSDGNLVLYTTSWEPIWNSGTQTVPGAKLAIQDDGNVVIYDINFNPIWWTL